MSKKIVVAEDNIAIGDAIQMMLEGTGYEVEIQADGARLRNMREPVPDLLLLDIWMSAGMDGGEICRHLKSQEATRHLPIILVSAHRETETIAKEAGADDFLLKPFQMGELLALVKKYVG